VAAVVVEVVAVVGEYPHLDRLNKLGKMCPHHEERLKPWDNSPKFSPEIEAKLTTSLMSSADILD
jgi:hypothetical protein